MYDHGLASWMDKRRQKSPDKIALIYGEGSTVTYRELADGADRVSALLHARGVTRGDRVALMSENSPEFLQVLFGVMQLGAVFVPVNTRLVGPEIAHVLRDSGAHVVIHEPEFTERVEAARRESDVEHVILTGEGSPERPGLSALIRAAQPGHTTPELTLDSPAAILYTSGTTGRAKGAVLSHRNLTWVSLNTLVDYDVVSTDVALMISPLFHAASLGMGALPVMLKGATIVLERGFDPGRALLLIEQYGVTMLSGVPTTYQLMADHPAWASTDLTTLRKLTCGGSAVPTRVLNAYEERGLSFSQGYGMTETSPGATSLAPDMTRSKQGSVGLPHFFCEVRITDEQGALVPNGKIGEIEVHGPNVFPGYHELPEASEAAFTSDGWLRTGDLGYLDDDGYLFVSDRAKDMIISGGENVYPAELENLINDLEGVASVAVIGVPDERWGEVPWAIVVAHPGARITTDAVRAHLDGRVARFKLPKNVVMVEDLPRTASGKVKKAELRARYASEAGVS